mmetsp:Transcript_122496/g.346394  ORF Transcript_122496/g.346394 Transcript_122496/m.346394 type:complete len:343 (+) Transcript_122496:26-1054(+)
MYPILAPTSVPTPAAVPWCVPIKRGTIAGAAAVGHDWPSLHRGTAVGIVAVTAGTARGAARARRRGCRRNRCAIGRFCLGADVDSDAHALAMRRWVDEFVIGLGFCPWAKPADEAGRIRIVTSSSTSPSGVMADLALQAERLPRAEADGKCGQNNGGTDNTSSAQDFAATLPHGVATTTILVCPYAEELMDFGTFQAFYDQELKGGYVFADKDLYIAPFHPRFGDLGPEIATGDRIDLGTGPDGKPACGTVVDAEAGFGEAGQRLAKVRMDGAGEECFICLPPRPDTDPVASLASRAPRPALHLLRIGDLDRAEDAGLLDRNRRRARELGEEGVSELLQRCG